MLRLVVICLSLLLGQTLGQYTPDWDSLDSRPLPPWYDEAKIGIFMHLGPYSVPGVGGSFEKGGAEWFWLHSTNPQSISAEYLKNYFPPKFTYQDFGAQLTMEFFDAKEIARMVRDAGAK